MAWNGSDGAAKPQKVERKTRPSAWRGLLAALIVVVGAAGVCLYFFDMGKGDVGAESKKVSGSKRIAEVSPALPNALPDESDIALPVAANPNKRYEDGVEVVAENVRTNSSGAVIEKLTLADGRKISKVHPPKPLFENTADQVIALAVSTKPGESMPPLPDISNIDKEFADSLLAPIQINDDDPDDIKEIKAKVLEVKAYLIEEIKNGGSVVEALMAHQKEMETMADSRLMAIQEMQKLREEDGDEAAREFAEKVNESFKVRGIPEIPVPGKKAEQSL